MADYIYDAGWERERERLRGLEAASDPATLAALDEVGVAPGWRCLEVGAGGGSVAAALCQRVGPDGEVVAVDLDTRFVEALDEPALTVHRLDIVTDEVPGAPFDLVHSRAVLEHLPTRDEVLRKLVGLLRPGGWAVLSDVDFQLAITADPEQVAAPDPEIAARGARMWAALAAMMRPRGIDPEYGRRLPFAMAAAGLVDVQATSTARVLTPSSPSLPAARWSLEHFRRPLVDQGLLGEDDLDALLADLDRPLGGWSPTMVTAWGRRPG